MPKELVNGVSNYYGARIRHEAVVGRFKTGGAEQELVFYFTGANYALVSAQLPAGAYIISKPIVEIEEAFNLGGTTPTLLIGTSGSVTTNYLCSVSEANAEAIGTYVSGAPAGTLAVETVLAANTNLVVGLGGTSPTATAVGKAKVIVKYRVA
jgi:hypothetical protein